VVKFAKKRKKKRKSGTILFNFEIKVKKMEEVEEK